MKRMSKIYFKIIISINIPLILFVHSDLLALSYSDYLRYFNAQTGNNFLQSDTSKIYEIVYTEGKCFLAFDKGGKKLFEVFPFDNGPDYPSEGLFRIIENGKIGYADELGTIRIKPQFKAALPFQNGMAAFCTECYNVEDGEHQRWIGGKWGFINNEGSVVIQPKFDRIIEQFENGIAKVESSGFVILINKNGDQVNTENIKYKEWITLLGNTARLAAKLFFENKITVDLKWLSNDKFIFSSNVYLDYLRITILNEDSRDLLEYNIIPWQNFAIKLGNDFLISMEELNTVTDYAIIYTIFKPRGKHKTDVKTIEKFNRLFQTAFERELNNQLLEDKLAYPENVQFISKNNYLNYIDLQIAEPGSIVPDDSQWVNLSKEKMIYLQLIPDIGTIQKRWIKTNSAPTDTYYTSLEDDLLECFEQALNKALEFPMERVEIFNHTKSKMRKLFSAANSYVNFLYDKYEERLKRWLFINLKITHNSNKENIFGDYQPKLNPDTIIDYMPSLNDELEKLPTAELDNFLELVNLLKYYQEKSIINPGHWEEGNMILGAQQQEYKPSENELLTSEVGDRLSYIIKGQPKDKLEVLKRKEGIKLHELEYKKYTFIHVDVMGSGRFFYVDKIQNIKLKL